MRIDNFIGADNEIKTLEGRIAARLMDAVEFDYNGIEMMINHHSTDTKQLKYLYRASPGSGFWLEKFMTKQEKLKLLRWLTS